MQLPSRLGLHKRCCLARPRFCLLSCSFWFSLKPAGQLLCAVFNSSKHRQHILYRGGCLDVMNRIEDEAAVVIKDFDALASDFLRFHSLLEVLTLFHRIRTSRSAYFSFGILITLPHFWHSKLNGLNHSFWRVPLCWQYGQVYFTLAIDSPVKTQTFAWPVGSLLARLHTCRSVKYLVVSPSFGSRIVMIYSTFLLCLNNFWTCQPPEPKPRSVERAFTSER